MKELTKKMINEGTINITIGNKTADNVTKDDELIIPGEPMITKEMWRRYKKFIKKTENELKAEVLRLSNDFKKKKCYDQSIPIAADRPKDESTAETAKEDKTAKQANAQAEATEPTEAEKEEAKKALKEAESEGRIIDHNGLCKKAITIINSLPGSQKYSDMARVMIADTACWLYQSMTDKVTLDQACNSAFGLFKHVIEVDLYKVNPEEPIEPERRAYRKQKAIKLIKERDGGDRFSESALNLMGELAAWYRERYKEYNSIEAAAQMAYLDFTGAAEFNLYTKEYADENTRKRKARYDKKHSKALEIISSIPEFKDRSDTAKLVVADIACWLYYSQNYVDNDQIDLDGACKSATNLFRDATLDDIIKAADNKPETSEEDEETLYINDHSYKLFVDAIKLGVVKTPVNFTKESIKYICSSAAYAYASDKSAGLYSTLEKTIKAYATNLEKETENMKGLIENGYSTERAYRKGEAIQIIRKDPEAEKFNYEALEMIGDLAVRYLEVYYDNIDDAAEHALQDFRGVVIAPYTTGYQDELDRKEVANKAEMHKEAVEIVKSLPELKEYGDTIKLIIADAGCWSYISQDWVSKDPRITIEDGCKLVTNLYQNMADRDKPSKK